MTLYEQIAALLVARGWTRNRDALAGEDGTLREFSHPSVPMPMSLMMAVIEQCVREKVWAASHLSPEAARAAMRPADFADRSPEDQWAIDKSLGILDWDGK